MKIRDEFHSRVFLVLLLAWFGAGEMVQAANITVTNTADAGPGTLRAALASANNGDTINFALPTPAKITLTSGELFVSKNVNIFGPGSKNLALDGNGASRVFHFGSNTVS